MSGMAGAFVTQGGRVDRDALVRVVDRIAHRGPDGIRTWHGAGVSMTFAKFARTPDAVFDAQPQHDAASSTCVTFDGRLDNREELATQLSVRLSEQTCDVALVARAYERWGVECAARLLGDFALAIWDGRERRLFIARDAMAVRPLFYRTVDGAFWWASDQRALIELGMPAIDEGFVAEHLSGRATSITETFYEGIRRLPMAHAAVIAEGRFDCWRYWRPDADGELRYRDARDYEHHYRAVLSEAVRARLRMHGRGALLLSGGIDSGSVAVEIARLRDQGHRGAAGIKAFSMTVPGSRANEEPVIRDVLERVQLPSEMHAAQEPREDYFASDAEGSLDLPLPASASMSLPLRDAALRSGRSILFTGYGGDDWFEASYADLGECFRRGRLLAAGRLLAEMGRVRNYTPVAQLVRLGIWTALPRGAKDIVRSLLRVDPVPAWIEPGFARKVNLADRLRHRPDEVEFRSLAQYDIFRNATTGTAASWTDQEERYMASSGLEQRHPLMDRRIIEFALALPAEMRCSRGVSKTLMRHAMRDELPAAVTVSPPCDDFGFLGRDALARLGGIGRLREARPVQRGWIRAAAIDELFHGLENGVTRCLWPLCATTGVDFWLRAVERARAQQERSHGHEAFRARA